MTPGAPPPRPVYTAPQPSGPPRGWLKMAPVSRALLVVNAILFVLEGFDGTDFWNIPTKTSVLFGANLPHATLHDGRVETLVTACFLHAGLLHVGFNMMVLFQAGPLVERSVGSARMAPMYLLSGILASLASAVRGVVFHQEMPSVGASGAIMGLLAAAMVIGWRAQGFRAPLTQSLFRWLLINLAFGFMVNLGAKQTGVMVDNAAHLGGAVAGALIALTWRRGVKYSTRATVVIVAACALVVAGAFGVVGWHDIQDPWADFRPSE
jgi:rhomboid protease GluP